MSRIRLFIALVVLGSIFMMLLLFVKTPLFNKAPSNTQTPGEQTLQNNDNILDPTGLAAGVRDFLAGKTEDAKDSVANTIDDTRNQLATKILGDSEQTVNITIPANAQQESLLKSDEIITIDLQKNELVIFNLKKKTNYYVVFKNVPKSTCLYLQGSKYEIESEKLLLLEFKDEGKYTLSTNLCDLNYNSVGTITVE